MHNTPYNREHNVNISCKAGVVFLLFYSSYCTLPSIKQQSQVKTQSLSETRLSLRETRLSTSHHPENQTRTTNYYAKAPLTSTSTSTSARRKTQARHAWKTYRACPWHLWGFLTWALHPRPPSLRQFQHLHALACSLQHMLHQN